MRRLFLLCLFSALSLSAAGPQDVLPVRPSEGAVLLNGDWKFRYVAGLDAASDEAFFQPAFSVATWKNIPVPGNWELYGFAPPKYDSDTDPGLGLYRRTFRVAKEWRGRRVYLRFDGVLFGFTAWVNGKPIGEWASSFNPVTFDITDALLSGDADNVLAVRVTTRSKGWDFDTMDCWGLSGIFRDVTLFSTPEVHFADYTARTTIGPGGTADLDLEIVASSSAGASANVEGKLIAPDGKTAHEFRIALADDGRGATHFRVPEPRLWTAETPSLYRLEMDLRVGGSVVQHYSSRIGLREVTIRDGILRLNGTPVKLHGADHHDIWPEVGRAANEALIRRDLELIRAANINFIRTSHYPPHPRFIELCDEMGIYVDAEVPFIHGRQNLKDPSYQEVLNTRARATVMRDKNHPSIIFWSVGNENPVNQLGLNAGKLVKQLDPTRPITFPTVGSYFRDHYTEFPDFADLYAPHYPGLKTITDYAKKLARPIVFTEFAHERGLARTGAGVQDLWEAMYQAPRVAGGAVWMFQDQGILRTAEDRSSVANGDLMVWIDEHHYYDTNGYYGVDGIVYSDRSPQIDFWQVRKVFSPVQIPERSLAAGPGAQKLTLHAGNRFDFRTLAGMHLNWSLRRNRTVVEKGVVNLSAKPHETETIPIAVTLPAAPADDVFVLELSCVDESGVSFYERNIRLDTVAPGSRWEALKTSLAASAPALDMTDDTIVVRASGYQLRVDRRTGQSALLDAAGTPIVSAFGPHTGRVLTINDLGKQREGEKKYWRGELLEGAAQVKTSATNTPRGILVSVSGVYARPGFPQDTIEGGYELLLTPSGRIEVSYRYTPKTNAAKFLETGFAVSVPARESEFRWMGEGPYSGYPGKDRLNEFGLWHLNREDQYFPGNRRSVEMAFLTAPDGKGVLIGGNGMTVTVDYRDDSTVFSQVVPLSDQADEGAEAEAQGGDVKAIAGKFELLPLVNTWPRLLTNWFGSPDEKAEIRKRFLHSYDQ